MMKRLSKRLSSTSISKHSDTLPVEMHTKLAVSVSPSENTLKVPIAGDSISADDLLVKVCKILGIGKKSAIYFALFQESVNSLRKFKGIELLSSTTKGVTICKWCFDLEDEKKLMEVEGALPLLYHQAKYDVNSGKIRPDAEKRAQLDALTDSNVELHHQYVSLCQEVDDYFSVIINDCQLHQDFNVNLFKLSTGTKFTLVLFRRGIRLRLQRKDYLISWRKIRSWTCVAEDCRMQFEVFSLKENNYNRLIIQTPQAHYVLSVVIELIKLLQCDLNGPMFQTTDMTLDASGKVVEWRNVLFATRRFNAEDELAAKYEDLTT